MAISWTCCCGTVVYKNNVGNGSVNSLSFDNVPTVSKFAIIVIAAWRVN